MLKLALKHTDGTDDGGGEALVSVAVNAVRSVPDVAATSTMFAANVNACDTSPCAEPAAPRAAYTLRLSPWVLHQSKHDAPGGDGDGGDRLGGGGDRN
eukprot:3206022-Prymnesium_polylepis.3